MAVSPDDQSTEGMRKVLTVADCEGKGKLLNEVRVYQQLVGSKPSPSSGVEIEDGPETAKIFCSDEPPHLMGEGRYPQPLSYIAGGIGT